MGGATSTQQQRVVAVVTGRARLEQALTLLPAERVAGAHVDDRRSRRRAVRVHDDGHGRAAGRVLHGGRTGAWARELRACVRTRAWRHSRDGWARTRAPPRCRALAATDRESPRATHAHACVPRVALRPVAVLAEVIQLDAPPRRRRWRRVGGCWRRHRRGCRLDVHSYAVRTYQRGIGCRRGTA